MLFFTLFLLFFSVQSVLQHYIFNLLSFNRFLYVYENAEQLLKLEFLVYLDAEIETQVVSESNYAMQSNAT
jgi:hypothetical protein